MPLPKVGDSLMALCGQSSGKFSCGDVGIISAVSDQGTNICIRFRSGSKRYEDRYSYWWNTELAPLGYGFVRAGFDMFDEEWEDLTEDQQETLSIFGYSERNWKHDDWPEDWPSAKYWEDIPSTERQALEKLGFDREWWEALETDEKDEEQDEAPADKILVSEHMTRDGAGDNATAKVEHNTKVTAGSRFAILMESDDDEDED